MGITIAWYTIMINRAMSQIALIMLSGYTTRKPLSLRFARWLFSMNFSFSSIKSTSSDYSASSLFKIFLSGEDSIALSSLLLNFMEFYFLTGVEGELPLTTLRCLLRDFLLSFKFFIKELSYLLGINF
jgi:hypothetical protein